MQVACLSFKIGGNMKEYEQIIDIARAEVGYLEKSRKAYNQDHNILYDKTAGAGSDNLTKYAKEMDALNVYNGAKQGYPWCNVFVDWCFVQALGLDRARELLIGFSAGCTQDYNWFKNAGQVYNSPEKGDLVIFGDCDHIGIVVDVNGSFGSFSTIEGNTSGRTGLIANGGQVAEKTYSIGTNYVKGYCRPNYDGREAPKKEPNNESNEITYSLIRKGSKGNLVRIAQEKLLAKGYHLPKYGADGDFGSETERAVRELQADAKRTINSNIEVDGEIGPVTWGILNSDFQKPSDSYPGDVIREGKRGAIVRKIQNRLIELGYSCGKYGADSIFGSDTAKAVRKFQRDNSLIADGEVGPLTWAKLF